MLEFARRRRNRAVVTASVLGTLATIAFSALVIRSDFNLVQVSFENDAAAQLRVIASDFQEASKLLRTVGAYVGSVERPLSRAEFVSFAKALHADAAGLRDVGWAAHVTADQRGPFEAAMRARGLPDFQIVEGSPQGLVRAADRAEYYPIIHLEGNPKSDRLTGLDAAVDPARSAAINTALKTRVPSATVPLTLVTVARIRGGLMSFLAIPPGGSGALGDLPADLGVVLGAFDIDEMIGKIVAGKVGSESLNLFIFEPGAGPNDAPIYRRLTRPDPTAPATLASLQAQTHWKGNIPILQQQWVAIFTPGVPLGHTVWHWYTVMPLAAGTIMTAMVVSHLLLSLRRTEQLEALTASLRHTSDDLRQNMATVSRMARHDLLTSLPNRAAFREHMAEAVSLLGRGFPFAVLCLDLDEFKAVNDTLGHPAGDELLLQAAARMQPCLRETDRLARLGGDEFAAIVRSAFDVDEALIVANRLVSAIGEPYLINGHTVTIGVSIGVAMAPRDGTTAEMLQAHADMALYAAKAAGRGTVRVFDPQQSAAAEARRVLVDDLRRAVGTDEFELYYQPIVRLGSNRVTGFEALLRWNHPAMGLLTPDHFIGLAEETGLIVPLGQWVLRQACQDAATWPASIGVSINLSPMQLQSCDLSDDVVAALTASSLPASRLELEITEAAALEADRETLASLERIRHLGVQIAFDDFGTGLSSLTSVKRCPVDRIKIDRTFVAELGDDPSSTAIVQALVGLGLELGLATTAEGVETRAQAALLHSMGCSHGQGYFYSRPRPVSDVPGLLAELCEPVTPAGFA